MEEKMICSRCNCELERGEIAFEYMGNHFTHMLPRCPVCRQVYIPESVASGKMNEVEMMLEEK